MDRRTAGPPDCAVRFATAKTGRLPADKAARVAHAGVVKETSLLSRIAIRVFLAHALSSHSAATRVAVLSMKGLPAVISDRLERAHAIDGTS